MKRIKIIAPSHLKEDTLKLYTTQVNSDLFGVDFISINRFIKELAIDNCDFNSFKEKASLSKQNIYHDAVNNKSFFSKLYSLKKEIASYQIDLDKVNINSELKELLNLLDFKYDLNKLDKDYSDTYILDIPYSIFEEKILKILVDRGAKRVLKFNKQENKKYVSTNRTIRNTYDSVMQDIINKDYKLNEVGIILNDFTTINLLKSSLYYYDIPANYLIKTDDNLVAYKINLLVQFYLNKEDRYKIYKEIIKNNILFEASNNTVKYVDNEYYLNYPNKDFLNPERIFDEKKDNYYFLIEDEYFRQASDLLNNLKELVKLDNLSKAFIYILELLNNDSVEYKQIRSLLLDFEQEDINEDSIINILSRLNNNPTYKEAITITDIKHPIYNKKVLYLLDSTAKNYPPTPSISNLVNVEELEKCGYSTQVEFTNNIKERLSFLDYSEITYFTYPGINSDGKKNDVDLSLKKIEKSNLPLVDSYKFFNYDYEIKEDVSSLFIKDNKLKEKVTQLENYFKCPFSFLFTKLKNNYEINTNSKIKEIELNNATTGNIVHKVMELLVNEKKENYLDYSIEDLDRLIDTQIEELTKYLPAYKKILEVVAYNLKDSLLLKKEILKLSTDDYVPYKAEEKVNDYSYKLSDNKELIINGIIDRIDINKNNDTFRIIDYKTGRRQLDELKPKNVTEGRKLQLLVYSVIFYELQKDLKPAYASYINLKNEALDLEEYKLDKETYKITPISDEDKSIKEEYLQDNKLKTLPLMDDCKDKEYINQIGRDKLNYDNLKESLDVTLNKLFESIKENKFNKWEEDINKCKYCDFVDICPARLFGAKNEEENEDGDSNEE